MLFGGRIQATQWNTPDGLFIRILPVEINTKENQIIENNVGEYSDAR